MMAELFAAFTCIQLQVKEKFYLQVLSTYVHVAKRQKQI